MELVKNIDGNMRQYGKHIENIGMKIGLRASRLLGSLLWHRWQLKAQRAAMTGKIQMHSGLE